MAKKIMVCFPSYRWVEVDAKLLPALVESAAYEYDYQTGNFHRDDACRIELRVAEGNALFGPKAREEAE